MNTLPQPSVQLPNKWVLAAALVVAHLICLPAAAQVSQEALEPISTPDRVDTSIGTLEFLDGAPLPPTVATQSPTLGKPRLVLQITVDQFRGDLPTRYADRLGEGGLRYLLEEGIHYNNAHHAMRTRRPSSAT